MRIFMAKDKRDGVRIGDNFVIVGLYVAMAMRRSL